MFTNAYLNTPNGIVVDAAGRIRLANRAASALFGFEGPAAGKTILEATRHHEVAAVVGRLERVKNQYRLVMSVHLLQRSVALEVDPEIVEALE